MTWEENFSGEKYLKNNREWKKKQSLTETVKLCVMNNSTHNDEFGLLLKIGIYFVMSILVLLIVSVVIAFL